MNAPSSPKKTFGIVGIGGAIAIGILVVFCLLSIACGALFLRVRNQFVDHINKGEQEAKDIASKVKAMNNMKELAIAFHRHNDELKFIPSPKMKPEAVGMKPRELSWRVTILPYIHQRQMYNQFDLNAAWDSPANKQFLKMRPTLYENATRTGIPPTETTVQYFTGPKTMFPDPLTKVNILKDIPDGISQTILFAEALNPVPWSKPADMAITPNGPLPLPKGRFLTAMADGTVRMIDSSKVSDAILRSLIDPADGKNIDLFDLE